MGRGGTTATDSGFQQGLVKRIAVRPGPNGHPAPALDSRHPISDLWELPGPIASREEEQRCLRQLIETPVLRVDGRPGTRRAPRHSRMAVYSNGAAEVLALAMNRRFAVEKARETELGGVGDYLVETPDGAAGVVRRQEFQQRFSPVSAQPLSELQVPIAEARQALLDGELEIAFDALRTTGSAVGSNVEVRELSESLLDASWKSAGSAVDDSGRRTLAERITDWLGTEAGLAAV